MSRICERGASGFLVDAWSVPHILLHNEQNLQEGCIGFPRRRLVGFSAKVEDAENKDNGGSGNSRDRQGVRLKT